MGFVSKFEAIRPHRSSDDRIGDLDWANAGEPFSTNSKKIPVPLWARRSLSRPIKEIALLIRWYLATCSPGGSWRAGGRMDGRTASRWYYGRNIAPDWAGWWGGDSLSPHILSNLFIYYLLRRGGGPNPCRSISRALSNTATLAVICYKPRPLLTFLQNSHYDRPR